jgi:hypothetical protein
MLIDAETALILGLLIAVFGALLAVSLATDSDVPPSTGADALPTASDPKTSRPPGTNSLDGSYGVTGSDAPRASAGPPAAGR